jgi:hypothetical protein
MISMKKLLLIFGLCSAGLMAQQVAPNCVINFGPWTDTNVTPVSFNGTTNCAYWVMSYQVSGFSAVSVEVDSAVGVQGAPGTFGLFQGATSSGSNPSTAVDCTTPANCTATFTGVVGYYRVSFTSHTGNGTIQGTLQGYKTFQGLGGNTPVTGGGCVGTMMTPCIVAGPDSPGATVTQSPVFVAGLDNSAGLIAPLIISDATGGLYIQGSEFVGSPPGDSKVDTVGAFDGTNVQRVASDPSGNLQTGFVGFGTFNAGQQAVTGTAAALPSNAARSVCVQALQANSINVYVGTTGVTIGSGLELQPGQSTCQPVNNSSLIFVVGSTTGASVAWSLVN